MGDFDAALLFCCLVWVCWLLVCCLGWRVDVGLLVVGVCDLVVDVVRVWVWDAVVSGRFGCDGFGLLLFTVGLTCVLWVIAYV